MLKTKPQLFAALWLKILASDGNISLVEIKFCGLREYFNCFIFIALKKSNLKLH